MALSAVGRVGRLGSGIMSRYGQLSAVGGHGPVWVWKMTDLVSGGKRSGRCGCGWAHAVRVIVDCRITRI